jgi:hypothetical protein
MYCMRRQNNVKLILWLLVAGLALVGCRPAAPVAPTAAHEHTVASEWFTLQLKLVQETAGFTPPVAARAFGYSGVTLYEAVVPGMPGYQTLAGQLNEMPALPQPAADQAYHWPTVANSALASISRKLFPTASKQNMVAIAALEEKLAAEFAAELDTAVFERSVTHGRLLAELIYIWSLSDGGYSGYVTNFPADYVSPAGLGLWHSTPPDYLPALQPHWGDNRPLALPSRSACDPGPPPEYSEDPASAFYAEALEVYRVAGYLTEEQRAIALFWSDDPGVTATPPGHWIAIVTQIMRDEGYSLAVAAEAYAKVGIAVTDAFISCWETKYKYGLLRPISYIQRTIDPHWNNPLITDPVLTPPFPEYTSGHSVQSGAAAWVLTDLFGDNFAFVDRTHEALGYSPRAFGSFYEAAEEAAISRLYGGIHYRTAIERGVEQGHCIGRQITALQFRP